MIKKQVTNGFAQLGIAQFSMKLKEIVSNMTQNAYFPTVQTDVQALATAATAYYELVTLAKDGSTIAITNRNTARANIIDMLHSLGDDVSYLAKGDINMLVTTGFSFTQDRKPTPNMKKPGGSKITAGINSGEVKCKTYHQRGLLSVNFYLSTDPAALTATEEVAWESYSSNKTNYTYSGLTPGQRYFSRVGLVGVRGQEVFSDVVTFIAQ